MLRKWNEKAYFTLWTQNFYCFFYFETIHKYCIDSHMPNIEHEYFPYSYDDGQKGKFFLHGDHFKYCLPFTQVKEENRRKKTEAKWFIIPCIYKKNYNTSCHWNNPYCMDEKGLEKLAKNVSKFDMCYNSMRCVLFCCVVLAVAVAVTAAVVVLCVWI